MIYTTYGIICTYNIDIIIKRTFIQKHEKSILKAVCTFIPEPIQVNKKIFLKLRPCTFQDQQYTV